MKWDETKIAYELMRPVNCVSSLSEGALRMLAETAVAQTFESGKYIWKNGDSGEFCCLILSGMAEITRPSGNEGLSTMGIFARGDMIGLSALIKRSVFPGSARAIAPQTQVLKFYLRPILQEKSPIDGGEIAGWVREMLLRHEQILRDKIDILSAGSVENRLFEFLRHLNRRFGVPQSRTSFTIPLQVTKTQAARMLDIRVETALRLINGWQKKGLLIWGSKQITILNLDALERYILHEK